MSGRRFASAVALGFALSPAGSSLAQGEIEEVLVMATKREQTLQDVSVAVTVVSAEALEDAQILDILDLQSIVPSLRVTQLQTSTQTNFLIRGFGNGANNPGIESSVGVFIDGVYRSRSAAQIGDFIDVERVEVLRGPQSTLFGQNASAGVINVITRQPEFEFGGSIELGLGNDETRQLRGRVTGPLNDQIAFSLAGSINERDGYFSELVSGEQINDRDRWDVRGQLLIEPNDAWTLRLMLDTSRIDERCCGVVNLVNGPTGALVEAVGGEIFTGDPFDRKAFYDRPPQNLVDNDGLSLHLDWNSQALTFSSITALRQQQAEFDYDSDFTSASLVQTNRNLQDIDTLTQEFRLSRADAGRASWLIGLYYVTEDVAYDNRIEWGDRFRPYATGLIASQIGDPTVLSTLEAAVGLPAGTFFTAGQGSTILGAQDTGSYTLFGQLDWTLSDRLTLTAGLAHTNNRKDVSLAQFNDDVYSSLNLVEIGFGGAFAQLTGGLPPTPDNIAANPAAAATADFLSVTPCSAQNPPPACNSALALYGLQFLSPVVPFASDSDDSETTYTLRLSYALRDSMTLYAGVSTGFKATSWNLSRDSKPFAPSAPDRSPLGGFVNPYYGRYGTRYAGPEESTVAELGFKGEWARAAVNVAVFDQEIDGFQSNLFTGTGFNLSNAGRQSTQGLEVETLVRATDQWSLLLSGTFLDPLYDSFIGAEGPNGPTDLSGTRPAGIHEQSISAGFNYTWSAGAVSGFVRADYLYESRVAVVENVAEEFASREVGTLNASVGLSYNDWEVMLWGRNLNDDEYLLSAFPSVAQFGSLSGYPNAPRSYGVTLRKNFR